MSLFRVHLMHQQQVLAVKQILRSLSSIRGVNSSSNSSDREEEDEGAVVRQSTGSEVTEMCVLKDFVVDAIVRGSSVRLPHDATCPKSSSNDCDCTDIHQRHFLKLSDLRQKELDSALSLYDQADGEEDFVKRYQSSPTLSVSGVIAPPHLLYHKVARIKRLMNAGLKPMASLFSLTTLPSKTVEQRLSYVREIVSEESLSPDMMRNHAYKTIITGSLYHARRQKLIAKDEDVVKRLVNSLPLELELKIQLIERTKEECAADLNAMSVTEIKITILNHYLSHRFPSGGFNAVTDSELGIITKFRLKNAIAVTDIIAGDTECCKNLSHIHFGSLSRRLTPEDLQRLLSELPFIGDSHISATFFHKQMDEVFCYGIQRFIDRYHFLRNEGFSDVEIVKRSGVMRMHDQTLGHRLNFWYSVLGKERVVASNMGLRLTSSHLKAKYHYAVTCGRKPQTQVHHLFPGATSRTQTNVVAGYLHEFGNKFDLRSQELIDKIYACPDFRLVDFDYVSMHKVYQFLVDKGISEQQLMNSPYLLTRPLDQVNQVYTDLSRDPDCLQSGETILWYWTF